MRLDGGDIMSIKYKIMRLFVDYEEGMFNPLPFLFIVVLIFMLIMPGLLIYREIQFRQSPEDLKILYECVKKYKSEIGTYPETLEDLTVTKDGYGPWIEKIPEDPCAGEIYRYKCNREGWVLFSVGRDREASSNISDGILGDDKGYHEYNEE